MKILSYMYFWTRTPPLPSLNFVSQQDLDPDCDSWPDGIHLGGGLRSLYILSSWCQRQGDRFFIEKELLPKEGTSHFRIVILIWEILLWFITSAKWQFVTRYKRTYCVASPTVWRPPGSLQSFYSPPTGLTPWTPFVCCFFILGHVSFNFVC